MRADLLTTVHPFMYIPAGYWPFLIRRTALIMIVRVFHDVFSEAI